MLYSLSPLFFLPFGRRGDRIRGIFWVFFSVRFIDLLIEGTRARIRTHTHTFAALWFFSLSDLYTYCICSDLARVYNPNRMMVQKRAGIIVLFFLSFFQFFVILVCRRSKCLFSSFFPPFVCEFIIIQEVNISVFLSFGASSQCLLGFFVFGNRQFAFLSFIGFLEWLPLPTPFSFFCNLYISSR